jgi:hypothetical protein
MQNLTGFVPCHITPSDVHKIASIMRGHPMLRDQAAVDRFIAKSQEQSSSTLGAILGQLTGASVHRGLCDSIRELFPPDLPCIKDWQFEVVLGKGEFGVTLGVRSKIDGRLAALKIMVESIRDGQDEGEREYAVQREFAAKGLAPRALATCRFRPPNGLVSYFLVLMDRVDGTLGSLIASFCQQQQHASDRVISDFGIDIVFQLHQLVDSLIRHGCTHGDMHVGNVGFVYDKSNAKTGVRLTLIDFGRANVSFSYPYWDAIHAVHYLCSPMQVELLEGADADTPVALKLVSTMHAQTIVWFDRLLAYPKDKLKVSPQLSPLIDQGWELLKRYNDLMVRWNPDTMATDTDEFSYISDDIRAVHNDAVSCMWRVLALVPAHVRYEQQRKRRARDFEDRPSKDWGVFRGLSGSLAKTSKHVDWSKIDGERMLSRALPDILEESGGGLCATSQSPPTKIEIAWIVHLTGGMTDPEKPVDMFDALFGSDSVPPPQITWSAESRRSALDGLTCRNKNKWTPIVLRSVIDVVDGVGRGKYVRESIVLARIASSNLCEAILFEPSIRADDSLNIVRALRRALIEGLGIATDALVISARNIPDGSPLGVLWSEPGLRVLALAGKPWSEWKVIDGTIVPSLLFAHLVQVNGHVSPTSIAQLMIRDASQVDIATIARKYVANLDRL